MRKEKPFTLWFEEIKSSSNGRDLKEIVAHTLDDGLVLNRHHADVMSLGFQHILTTNYDHTLEMAVAGEWKQSNLAQERHYSLFRRRSYNDRHVWHIHGDVGSTGSIMLGHEQYSGYISKRLEIF